MPGDNVLVKRWVELLEEVGPADLQHPYDLGQGTLPVRDMVEDPEPEDGIHGAVPVRQPDRVADKKRDPIPFFRGQIIMRLSDHPDVKVHGMDKGGIEHLLDKIRPCAPAAPYLQDKGVRVEPDIFLHPADLQALLQRPDGVIDR